MFGDTNLLQMISVTLDEYYVKLRCIFSSAENFKNKVHTSFQQNDTGST